MKPLHRDLHRIRRDSDNHLRDRGGSVTGGDYPELQIARGDVLEKRCPPPVLCSLIEVPVSTNEKGIGIFNGPSCFRITDDHPQTSA
jgi:hypothetical protein